LLVLPNQATHPAQPRFCSTDKVEFPWRHQLNPPERILDNDDLSGMPNNFRARLVRRLVACRELNLAAYEAVPLPFGMKFTWERELAENFAIAFGFAIEELLMNVFGGRVQVDEKGVAIYGLAATTDTTDAESETDSESKDDYLASMFEKNILEKYESFARTVKENPERYQLKLSVRPLEWSVESLFIVPLLSRKAVEEKPHLKGGYQAIEREFASSKSYSKIKEMTYELADKVGDSNHQRTVVADAAVSCMEVFQLVDSITGEVQGSEEEEEVVHIVRFELITETNKEDSSGSEGRKQGKWKIVDLDDALDGDVWW